MYIMYYIYYIATTQCNSEYAFCELWFSRNKPKSWPTVGSS